MTQTLITLEGTAVIPGAEADGDGLWVPLDELTQATGWKLEPEGACRGDVCVPIPSAREREFVRPGALNLAALARVLDQPVVHDAPSGSWVVGEAAQARSASMQSLEAPNFTLPDLEGRLHSLLDYRGRKVFLVSWASW
jgi:hypothetical protein